MYIKFDKPIRDPFILNYNKKYYLYFSGGESKTILCRTSNDLENWSKPLTVFSAPKNFHGTKNFFWAPECHYYKGAFYIFTSVYSAVYGHRIISVYKSDSPLGPFEDIAGGRITNSDFNAIDGTLVIDDGIAYMVYVREWVDAPNKIGSMEYARLSNDLSSFVGEPVHMFFANDLTDSVSGVTDGPFLFRGDDGRLKMIWSNFTNNGYVITTAYSDNGKINGKWLQGSKVYERGTVNGLDYDGGHGMIFTDNAGKDRIVFHAPNSKADCGVYECMCIMYFDKNTAKIVNR